MALWLVNRAGTWRGLRGVAAAGVATGLAALALFTPQRAEACGGLFCDGGDPMPIDQAEEQVLFIRDGDITETHIRVIYEGEAENFAWGIPLSSDNTPEFSVGSDAFFGRLLADSQPRYNLTNIGGDEECNGWGTAGESGGDATTGGGFVNLDAGGPGVEIQGTVGSFEFAVLSGGTVEGLMQWLTDNGYQQDPAAEPILEAYLNEGAKFAAVKLSADADNDAIHPIVIRYQGQGPCVPIRLTAIAAEDDMGIRLFALDSERLVPQNYEHVFPNLLRLEDWSWDNYKELVTMAVDEAGGRALSQLSCARTPPVPTRCLFEPLRLPADHPARSGCGRSTPSDIQPGLG